MAEYEYVTDAERVLLAERCFGGSTPSPLLERALEDILRARITHAVEVARREAAERIEAELICCDVFDRLGGKPSTDLTEAERSERIMHSICYWGEAARRLVLDVPKPYVFSPESSGGEDRG